LLCFWNSDSNGWPAFLFGTMFWQNFAIWTNYIQNQS
jgi:hypothetical protein